MKPSRSEFSDQSKTIHSKFPTIRFMTIGLWPGYGSKKSCVRLQGNWLRETGFIP